MADANLEAQKMAELMAKINDELARYGQLTTETENQKTDALVKAKYGLNDFTKGSKSAVEAVTSLASSVTQTAKAMYDGKKGAAAFNDSLDSMSKAATAAGVALSILLPGGILMKGIIMAFTALAGATIGVTKAANEMADKLYNSYTKISGSGAAAADGMSGVYKGAKKLGLSMNELDQYVNLINESSQDLALFGGTVYDGRKKIEDMGQAMEGQRASLFKLGITQEQQNEAMVGYMRLQQRSGNAQKQTTDQLAASARNYLLEQDALAKLTGMSVKDQQKAREAALMEEQFLAKVRQLQREGRHAEAEELQKLNIYYQSMGDEVGRGYRAMVNGNLRDENARKLMFTTQGEALATTQRVANGQMKAAEAFDATGKATQRYLAGAGDSLATLGEAGKSGVKYSEAVKLATMTAEDRVKLEEKVKKEQEAQLAGADNITNQQGDLIKRQQEVNKQMEDAVFGNISAAQKVALAMADLAGQAGRAFQALADITEKLVPLFEKLVITISKIVGKTMDVVEATSKEGAKGFFGAGGSELAGKAIGTGAGAVKGAAAGAAVGSIIPIVGTAIGAVLGGLAGGALGFFGGGAVGKGVDYVGQKVTGAAPEARAGGGPVKAGKQYMVGEKGPELFTPTMSGNITSTEDVGRMNQMSKQLLDQTSKLIAVNSTSFNEHTKIIDQTSDLLSDKVKSDQQVKKMMASMEKDYVKLSKITETDTKRSEKYSGDFRRAMALKEKFMKDELGFLEDQDEILEEMTRALEKEQGTEKTVQMIKNMRFGSGFGGLGFKMPNMSSGGGGGFGGGSARPSDSAGGGGAVNIPGPATSQSSQPLAGSHSGETTGQGIDTNKRSGLGLKNPYDQVKEAGLKVRPYGDVYQGGPMTDTAVNVAKTIQNTIDGFGMFTGLNDKYHQEKHPRSKHATGQGIDFTLGFSPTVEQAKDIKAKLKEISGVSLVKNEYFDPPAGDKNQFTTGPHFHVQTSAEEGTVVDGPNSGYPAMLHGNEAVIPLQNNAGNFVKIFEDMAADSKQMLSMLDEMVRTQKNSVDIQNKMLKRAT